MPKQYMSDQYFQELLEGVREMKAIQRGELPPARTTTLKDIERTVIHKHNALEK